MKLSEAIRLGALMHPQHFGSNYHYSDPDSTIIDGTCAVGGAVIAGFAFSKRKPLFSDRLVRCPVCVSIPVSLIGAVVHLNDDHRWTREQIADWVATVEDQYELAVHTEDSVPVAIPALA